MRQYIPGSRLAPFVKGYTIIESEGEMTNFILPDSNLVMAIRYKGLVSAGGEGQMQDFASVSISGIRQSARYIRYAPQSGNVLVIFRPGGAAAFFEEPLHELWNLNAPADALKGYRHSAELATQLAEAPNDAARIALVEAMLLNNLRQQTPDALMLRALRYLDASEGHARIKDLAETLPLSRDAFEKRFRRMVGTTPKQYAGIVRLRAAIDKGRQAASLTDLAYDAGYFDQSHFIKEFRLFTGQTPGSFFRSGPFW